MTETVDPWAAVDPCPARRGGGAHGWIRVPAMQWPFNRVLHSVRCLFCGARASRRTRRQMRKATR